MGVKSNVAAPKLVISNDSQSTTPSTTPMRPTPLTGNWGDYEWGMDIKDAVIESTTEKVTAQPQPEPQHMTVQVQPQREVIAVPAEPTPTPELMPVHQVHHSDSWDYNAPAYLSQTQSFTSPADSFNENYMQQHNPYGAPVVQYEQQAPSIRRYVPQQRIQASQYVPHQQQRRPQQRAPAPARQQQQQQQQVNRPLQVSRFAPPPPPPAKADYVFTKNGSADNAFYGIVMRWYDKVLIAQRAHPGVSPCPPAEQYLHDFPGWLQQVDGWWKRHFANRKGRPHRNNNSNNNNNHH